MKNITVGIVIGVCLAITTLHVWYLYKLNSRVSSLESFSIQVANLINNNKK